MKIKSKNSKKQSPEKSLSVDQVIAEGQVIIDALVYKLRKERARADWLKADRDRVLLAWQEPELYEQALT